MNKSVSILVVDDDEISIELVERALRKTKRPYRVVPAGNGLEALSILRGQSDTRIEAPFLVLLDLNMPAMNGFEFLDEIRRDDDLRQTVVFVLTTSDAPEDIARAYQEQIAGYMTKTTIGPQCAALIRLLDSYVNTVDLPA